LNNKTIQTCIKQALSKLDDHPYFIKKNNGKYRKSKFLHFSFVVQGNTIISWGWNHTGIAPRGYGYTDTVHAEVHAYERAKLKLNGSFEVLNLRFNKNGIMNISAPCKCCTQFLRVMGCKVVYFSTASGVASLKISS
jgi:hypothetical protein